MRKILVVEDVEENRSGAMKYFGIFSDVRVDFSENYADALERLQNEVYDYGIFDLNFPRAEGGEPEELGEMLQDEAGHYQMPSVVVSSHSGASTVKFYTYDGYVQPHVGLKNEPDIWKYVDEKMGDLSGFRRSRERLMHGLSGNDKPYRFEKKLPFFL